MIGNIVARSDIPSHPPLCSLLARQNPNYNLSMSRAKTSPYRLRLDYNDWDCELSHYKAGLTNICSLLKQRFVETFPHGHGRLWPCHRGMQARNVNFNGTIQNLCTFSAKPLFFQNKTTVK